MVKIKIDSKTVGFFSLKISKEIGKGCIIPLALMASESIAHEAFGLELLSQSPFGLKE